MSHRRKRSRVGKGKRRRGEGPGRGRRFLFHGSFTEKEDARRREKAVKGAFIREVTVRGRRRFAVLSTR